MSTRYVKTILPKKSLIIYNNIYYEIENIKGKKYALRRIESEIVENRYREIEQFDCEIRTIPLKTQKYIKKFNKFRESYNKTIEYLNKYKNSHTKKMYEGIELNVMLKLIDIQCGITERHLTDIQFYLKKTLDHTLEIYYLFKNPFNFIREDKQLISYTIADKICNHLDIQIPFEEKCKKWSYYHIIHKYNSFYVEPTLFYNDFKDLCNKNAKQYTEFIEIINNSIITKNIDGKSFVTTKYLYDFEKKLTKKLIDLYSNNFTNVDITLIDCYISKFEKYMSEKNNIPYTLDHEQKNAVKNILTHSFSVVTGFPGTGKSSIIQCVLFVTKLLNNEDIIQTNSDEYDTNSIDYSEYSSDDDSVDNDNCGDKNTSVVSKENLESKENIKTTLFVNSHVSIMSPTGLAYINIQNKCYYNNNVSLFNPKISGTCHKTLYNTFPYIQSKINRESIKKHKYHQDYKYDNNDDDIIYIPKTIIVDEVSMMDILMFDELINYCDKFNAQLILVGDHNQLPSIGPGCVLNSIIEVSNEYDLFNITTLVKIKRQECGSLLTNIVKMEKNILTKNDFVDDTMILMNISDFIDKDGIINKEQIYNLIETNNLNKDNCKFLSYFNGENEKSRSHPTNVLDLNNMLQTKFNENNIKLDARPFDKFNFKIGDIVIRTENETSEKGFRANGEQAIIKDYDAEFVYIQYLGNTNEDDVNIDIDRFYNEFKLAYALTVHKSQGSQYKNIVIFIEPNSKVWDKPALYTAISRAEERCFIIADYNEFLKVQRNIKNSKKPTLFLKEIETMYHIE